MLSRKKEYYVYLYRTTSSGHIMCCGKKVWIDSNEIYYVGKGTKKRAHQKRNRNVDTTLFIEQFGCEIEILKENLTEKQALDLEFSIIDYLSKQNTILTNRNHYDIKKVLDKMEIGFDFFKYFLDQNQINNDTYFKKVV